MPEPRPVEILEEREAARLLALVQLNLLDTAREERFDRIVRTARRVLGVPMALVTLLDRNRLWYKAAEGIPGTEYRRQESFCTHVVAAGAPLEVPDASSDDRFATNPLVTGDAGISFYAGVPLVAPGGEHVGTLCVLDTQPRQLSPEDRQALSDLAAWAELEFRVVTVERLTTELDRTRRWTSMIMASAAEAIVAVDRDGVITTANPMTERITGWPVGEVVGRHLLGTLMYQDADLTPTDVARHPVTRTLRSGETASSLDGVVWRRDSRPVPVLWSVSPIQEDGQVAGAVVVAQDATARHEVNRMKDEFISVVSHELRTPLTAIRGSLGLLTAGVLGELPPAATEMTEIAIRNTDRLVRLVNDILDLERLRSGRMQLVRQDVDLLLLAEQSLQNAVPIGSDTTDTPRVLIEGEPTVAHVDADRVVQTLVNLVGNAMKFTPPEGTVTVRVGTEDGCARVQVVDTGRGIPAEELSRIFDRFEQVDASDARGRGGTGLGLAIAKHIVEAHGGTVRVASEVGVGSTFTVLLPLATTAPDDEGDG